MTSEFDIDCEVQKKELLAEMETLWGEADALWDKEQNRPAFGAYVSADYLAVFNSLVDLKPTSFSFLEFGSGLGVATIMASRLGYEAYGIESETELVDHSRDYAERFAPDATFALGSFVPDEFEWDVAAGEEVHVTSIDHAAAYGDMDMQLSDFDLVYAYPWPTEHELYHSILRQFGSPESKLLIYDAREGILLTSFA
jgi:SAM-dependent methyltransferase